MLVVNMEKQHCMDRSHYSTGLPLDSLYLNRHLPHSFFFFFYSPDKQNGKSPPLWPRVWLAGFKGMFSFLETDTLQMHKRIPVTGLMCGCQALLCTVVSQQVSRGNRSEKPQHKPRETWQKHLGFRPERCHKISQDHGRISAGAEGDLSGLSTLPLPAPTCDLNSGLINQTGIESLFRRDV